MYVFGVSEVFPKMHLQNLEIFLNFHEGVVVILNVL